MINKTNKIFAIPAAAVDMPPNPNTAAIMAMTRKVMAKLNMACISYLHVMLSSNIMFQNRKELHIAIYGIYPSLSIMVVNDFGHMPITHNKITWIDVLHQVINYGVVVNEFSRR